jgi:hypothetical protein
MKRYSLSLALLCVSIGPGAESAEPKPTVLDVRAFGAVGDAKTRDTASIQKAIDAASAAGGGTVLLAGGTFLSGTLEIKGHVTLRVDRGATLLGSPQRVDYRKNRWYALLVARGQEDITVSGQGVIDGQGGRLAVDVMQLVTEKGLADPLRGNRPGERSRPQLIEFVGCRNVRVQDVILNDSSCWVQTYINCEGLAVERVTVRSVAYWNNDGLDIIDCHKVHVAQCDINSADDGICLKSANPGLACEDVLIEDCRVRSSGSALKFGTASRGGFRRVKVRNLNVYDTYRSAVAIESVDGASVEDVNISGVLAKNTGNAVFIRLGHRNRGGETGSVRNVTISDITVEVPTSRPDAGYEFPGPEVHAPHNLIPSSVTGLPGHPVQGVTLKNVTIILGGGGRREKAHIPLDTLHRVPERADRYPEFSMFGELPAWGFYCRHVEGLKFQDVTLRRKERDDRAALVFDDVKTMELEGVHVLSATTEPVIVLNNVHGATLRDCALPKGVRELIRAQGGCTGIRKP